LFRNFKQELSLDDLGKSIADIGQAVGYDDLGFFRRLSSATPARRPRPTARASGSGARGPMRHRLARARRPASSASGGQPLVLRPLGEPRRAVCRNPSVTPAFCRLAALRVDFRVARPADIFSSSWNPAWSETRAASLCEPREGATFFGRAVRLGPDRSAALRYRSAFVAIDEMVGPAAESASTTVPFRLGHLGS
jgi:hypothetical protein